MLQKFLSLYITTTTTIVILICYVIPSTMSQQCSYQQGIDLFGNDLYLTYANSITQCCTSCFNDASCQAWTYVPDTQACWIKSGMGSVRQGVSQRYSGLKNGQIPIIVSSHAVAQISANSSSVFLSLMTAMLTNIIFIQFFI